MKIQFLPPARAELVQAAAFYDEQQRGLGWRFWEEVDEHLR